jgi:hypothetical protein
LELKKSRSARTSETPFAELAGDGMNKIDNRVFSRREQKSILLSNVSLSRRAQSWNLTIERDIHFEDGFAIEQHLRLLPLTDDTPQY